VQISPANRHNQATHIAVDLGITRCRPNVQFSRTPNSQHLWYQMHTKILRTNIKGNGLFAVDVVGESYYQENLSQIAKCENASFTGRSFGVSFQIDARIMSEPNNPHDASAVGVLIRDLQVGHLDRMTASRLKVQLQKKGFDQIDSKCLALVVGGYNMAEVMYGVKLDIATESQQRSEQSKCNDTEFTFYVKHPVIGVDSSHASVGDSVNFWQHPKIPTQINIYAGGCFGEGLIGHVPAEFVIPIRRQLIDQLRFEASIEANVGESWLIRCRLIPRSETEAMLENYNRAHRERLEMILTKPYRPMKPLILRFCTEKDNLNTGQTVEVVELPNNETIIETDGRLPVKFRCDRTSKIFESTCDHEAVEKLVRLSIQRKPVVAKVTQKDRTQGETRWFTAEVPAAGKPTGKD